MLDRLGRDPASTLGLADSAASDARIPPPPRIADGRWPRIVTILRAIALLALSLVLAGWILTAITA
jgi:hypothetical protein